MQLYCSIVNQTLVDIDLLLFQKWICNLRFLPVWLDQVQSCANLVLDLSLCSVDLFLLLVYVLKILLIFDLPYHALIKRVCNCPVVRPTSLRMDLVTQICLSYVHVLHVAVIKEASLHTHDILQSIHIRFVHMCPVSLLLILKAKWI